MKRLRSFDRAARHAGSWHLAMSLACPECGGRVRGDMTYIWCEAWFCTWWGLWGEMNAIVHRYNKADTHDYLQANNFCSKEPLSCPLAANLHK